MLQLRTRDIGIFFEVSEGFSMKHVIRHNLDIDEARTVARKALESYADRLSEYSPRVGWPRNVTEPKSVFRSRVSI